ncbi:hypothetical protein SAMN05444166_5027 [Singulisphaera sp. GP187]|nr:hypothetical protein [Singulisphaera sp. GP187]SIO47181.1 hypothetical protein SAMN05444166_5027 [Singulisphaera sp. GP187]
MSSPTQKTSPLKVATAWILVAIPLGWGVYQSVVKSLPLFQTAPPATGAKAGRP